MNPAVRLLAGLRLPPVRREAWAGEAARARWQPRLEAAAHRTADLALEAAHAELAPVLLLNAPDDHLYERLVTAARSGLYARPLRGRPARGVTPWMLPAERRPRPATGVLAIARQASALEEFGHAWNGGDENRLRVLLGIPECCAAFHRESLAGWDDPWWPVAARSIQPAPDAAARRIELPAASSRALLVAALNLPGLWFTPCSLACAAAAATEARLATLAAAGTSAAERDWREELEDWPVEWSGYHGIAEIRTPYVKLMRNGDPLAEKLVVVIPGRRATEGGARGIRFPYA